jgi:ribonuclease PH
VAVGKVAGRIVLDLKKEEDNYGEADLPMALVPQSGRLVLLQLEELIAVYRGHILRVVGYCQINET